MPTADALDRHARLFVLIHQQARAEYTALRLQRRERRPLPTSQSEALIALAARSWAAPRQPRPHG